MQMEVRRLKKQQQIVRKVDAYKQQLALAMDEKANYDASLRPDIDLIIFSLINKLETLFWVLEIDLPEGDVLDYISAVNH